MQQATPTVAAPAKKLAEKREHTQRELSPRKARTPISHRYQLFGESRASRTFR